jgi:hypothetical protein
VAHALAAAITDVTATTAKILTPRQHCIAPGWLHQGCISSKLRTLGHNGVRAYKLPDRSTFIDGLIYRAFVEEVTLVHEQEIIHIGGGTLRRNCGTILGVGESHSAFPARRQRARSFTASDSK